ncbi:MAG: hypothetical protein HGA20_14975 [Geobacteraceae bacterium]|nr:hypothetical protein [Geobacteraceae bacterium]
MKARLNGVVSGVTLADAITQIECVWLTSAGEAPATAQAAGRGVTLTTSADLANFTQSVQGGVSPSAAGYALDSANLVAETTYYATVRVTESMTAGGTQSGDWSTPVSFLASVNATVVHALLGAVSAAATASPTLLTQILCNASLVGGSTAVAVGFYEPGDITAPVITEFVVPATSASLTVAITTLTASDAVGISGYMIKTTNSPPLAGDAGWSGTAPTTCTAPTEGGYTFYIWAKDLAGNVSTVVASGVCTVTIPDTTPAAFTFTDVTSAAFSTLYTSNTITVSGINTATEISITGGEYQINGGSWVTSAGTVVNGNTVTVRNTSSGSASTAVNTVLTIGGVSDTYSTTTGSVPTTAVITATGGDTTVVVAKTSGGVGATSYDIKWGTVAGTRSNTISGVTLPYTHTGRTNGTTYYYSLVAVNSFGSVESSEVSGVAGSSSLFVDLLNNSSLDTTRLQVNKVGNASGTEGTAGIPLLVPANSDAVLFMFKENVSRTETQVFKVDWKHTGGTITPNMCRIQESATAPVPGVSTTIDLKYVLSTMYNEAAANQHLAVNYKNTADAYATATAANYNGYLIANTVYRTIFTTSGGAWSLKTCLASNEATIYSDTGNISWSLVKATTNPLWFMVGDPYTDAWNMSNLVIVRVERA